MTRINVLTPRALTDQHLIAEYRELPMVAASLKRSLKTGRPLLIPKAYIFGKGHVSFFYNKGGFLCNRYWDLVAEMEERGFKPKYMERRVDFNVFIDNDLYGDYHPNDDALALNLQRIMLKVFKRPNWYKYYGKPYVTSDR